MAQRSGILLLFIAGTAAAQGTAPEWIKFEFARERVGHKVVAETVLLNSSGADLLDVRVVAVYYDRDRELRRSTGVMMPKISVGQAAPIRIEAEQLPNFDRYEVIVEATGKRYVYDGKEAGKPPALRRASLPKLVILSHKADKGTVTLVTQNDGESTANEPTVVLTFMNAQAAPVHKARAILDASVKGNTQATFEVTVPGVPAYASLQATPAWLVSEVPAPAEPAADAKDVAIRGGRIARLSDGSVHLTGSVKNGTAAAVQGVKIGFRLGKTEQPVALPGQIKPGASREFDLYVAECPPFDEVGTSIAFEDAKGSPPDPPPAAKPTSKRLSSTDVSQAPPPPVKDAQDLKPPKPAEPKGPKMTAEITGLHWIDSYRIKNVDSGQVGLLKVKLVDADGKPAQPIKGTFTIILKSGEAAYKRVPRNLESGVYKADAKKVTPQNAQHEKVYYDAGTGELWVGLLRTDPSTPVGLTMDITLAIPDAGTWTWLKLSPDEYKASAKGPDQPKK